MALRRFNAHKLSNDNLLVLKGVLDGVGFNDLPEYWKDTFQTVEEEITERGLIPVPVVDQECLICEDGQ